MDLRFSRPRIRDQFRDAMSLIYAKLPRLNRVNLCAVCG